MRALIISPVNPYPPNMGHKLAVLSDLNLAINSGIDTHLLYYDLNSEGALLPSKYSNAQGIQAHRGGRLVRFLRSLVSGYPAAAERYYTKSAIDTIQIKIQELSPDLVIVEDCLLAGLILPIRNACGKAKIISRSHNCMAQVCASQTAASSPTLRMAYLREERLWCAMELDALNNADETWAISEADANLLREMYNSTKVKVLPVSLDLSSYRKVPLGSGCPHTIVSVGTLDLKKALGMKKFLDELWPSFMKIDRQIKLVLAGRMSSNTHIRYPNVSYLGVVESDLEVMSTGVFALNTQTVGGGVKIKSLVAMAMGRVLLSTSVGTEGICVTHGVHYWNMEKLIATNELPRALAYSSENLQLAKRGRDLVLETYSQEFVGKLFQALLVGTFS